MADELIEAIKRDREAGTPQLGGWFWHGGRDHLSLATQQGGRRYIMGFRRKGLQGAQPTFQINGVMHGAIDDLTEYQVGDGTARGQKHADADRSVYRMDVIGVDHPDARRIARVPTMEARILADADRIEALEAENAALKAKIEENYSDIHDEWCRTMMDPTPSDPVRESAPSWLANCIECGRVVDTRERGQGGDPHGAIFEDGSAVCSANCYNAAIARAEGGDND